MSWKTDLDAGENYDPQLPNLGNDLNPNCDGNHCTDPASEVRRYPLGGSAGLCLCRACWDHENDYRAGRVRDGSDPKAFPQVRWEMARKVAG